MVKGHTQAVLLFLLCAASAVAQSQVTIELTSLAGVARGEGTRPAATGSSAADLTYRSTENRDVKGEFTLSAAVSETALVDVSRAFIKARFPGFRLTLGKTRLSWGEGFMFNAGDVIFDSVSTAVDLTADELRTAGKWLASAYVPLGRFSYAEALLLPPQIDPLDYAVDSRLYARDLVDDPPEPPGSDETSGGVRLVLRPGGVKLEAGYFYAGDEAEHRPYLSLQGHLLTDWHLSASGAMGIYGDPARDFSESLTVSLGLFQHLRTGYGSTVTLRLEGLLRPQGSWSANEEASSGSSEYALYLYPEISLSPDDRRSIFYRAIVSPMDLSAVHMLGGSWNIYQGFNLLCYAGVNSGERGDRFSWYDGYTGTAGGLPGYFISAGCEFVF
jgi:hypothetical protein